MKQTSITEYRHAIALASIFALRMLGLFMIYPVFSTYAHQYKGYTPALLGIALGIYGLSQAILQIPLGLGSDRFGRKPIITLGLLIFALGSIVAATTDHIVGIIIGRALQGAGAIGSTLMAMVADLTSEKNRTPAMAIIGLTIGITFAISMILGPVITTYLSIQGIFWLTSIFALSGILILYTTLPTPQQHVQQKESNSLFTIFKSILKNPDLLRLDLGIFILHAILTASFVVIPILLTHEVLLQVKHHWMIYLPVLLLSFIAAIPFIVLAERKNRMKQIFLGAIVIIACSQLSLIISQQTIFTLTLSLFFFFCSFNLLEACLPSMISKAAPASSKGTAMGIYSSSQFLGIFFGGVLGGWLYGHFSINHIFYCNAALAFLWWLIAFRMESRHAVNTPTTEIS